MSYLSFYRKYRPQTFEDVVGQEHIVRTIRNAIELDRVSHAYLFCGPRGTGKTTMAKLLAKGLNCAEGPTKQPCGVCSSCQGVASGTSVDVIEIDAASNRGIDEIRELREKIRYAPSVSRFKVYIIDEVHMLTVEAFNALLKTLEEPPSHALFILATTEPHRIPETIHSRCQRFDFHKLSPSEIAGHLASILEREGGEAEDDALRIIALHGDGSVRDAISILEQCYSYSGERITMDDVVLVLGITPTERILEFINAVNKRDVGELLRLVASLSSEGRDFRQFLRDAVSVYRDLIVLKLGLGANQESDSLLLSRVSPEDGKRIASRLELRECMYVLEKLSGIESELKVSIQPSITFEVGLIELVESIDSRSDVTDLPDVGSFSRRLTVVERKMAELVRKLSTQSVMAVTADTATKSVQETAVVKKDDSDTGQQEPVSSQELEREEHTNDQAVNQMQLDAVWEEILEGVKGRSRLLHAVMKEGRPFALQNGSLIIAFSSQRSFHMGRVSEEKNRKLIEEVATLVLGRPAQIVTRQVDQADLDGAGSDEPDGTGKRGRSARGAAKRQKPENDPLVKQVLEVFQGRIADSDSVEKDGDRVEGKHQQADEAGTEDAGRDAEGSR